MKEGNLKKLKKEYEEINFLDILLLDECKKYLMNMEVREIGINEWNNQDTQNSIGSIYIILEGYLVGGDTFELSKKKYFIERLIFNPGDICGELEAPVEIDGELFEEIKYKIAIRPSCKELSYLIAYTEEERKNFLEKYKDSKIKVLSIPENTFKELMKIEEFANAVYKNSYIKERRYAVYLSNEPEDIIQTIKLAYLNLKRINNQIDKLYIFPPASERLNALIHSSDFFSRQENKEEIVRVRICTFEEKSCTELRISELYKFLEDTELVKVRKKINEFLIEIGEENGDNLTIGDLNKKLRDLIKETERTARTTKPRQALEKLVYIYKTFEKYLPANFLLLMKQREINIEEVKIEEEEEDKNINVFNGKKKVIIFTF